MNVVPVASNGDGENENNDDDQPDIFQPLVSRWIDVTLVFAVAQSFNHGAIVIEEMQTMGTACEERLYPHGGCWPVPLECH